jgi:flagellar hook-associated protein 2
MSSPVSSTGGSGSSSTQSNIDYLGYLGSLSSSPFDPNVVINALLNVQQQPISQIQTQIKNVQTDQSIYKSIGADATALQNAAFSLSLQSTIQANAVTSSNSSAVTATAGPNVAAGSYTVAVSHLATATVAASTAQLGLAINGTTPLSALNLSAPVTAGSFSVVIDGTVQQITVDPTKSLTDPNGALTLLQQALTAGMQSSDPGASAAVSVNGNKVQVQVNSGTAAHSISFGASGDSSNFLQAMNLSTANATVAVGGNATMSSSTVVGVAQTGAILTQANLATGLNNTSGSFTVNGVAISWNASQDSINSVIGRINSSSAGVTASYNATTDQLQFTNTATGQGAMALQDVSGNFLAAMNLAPGTTNAQVLGQNAALSINGGATISSASNTITNAIPGLSINALALTSGTPATLTVGPDVTGITKNVQTFVTAANKLLTDINTTQQKDPTTGTYSFLLGDFTLTGLANSVLNMITGQVAGSGTYQSLQDLGITTGAVGSHPGTTNGLTLDASKLSAALTANPSQVAALFAGTVAVNGFQGVGHTLNTYLNQQTNAVNGPFALEQNTGDTQIKQYQARIASIQDQINQQRQILINEFSAMTTALGSLNAQSAALASLGISITSANLSGGTSSSSTSSSSSGH